MKSLPLSSFTFVIVGEPDWKARVEEEVKQNGGRINKVANPGISAVIAEKYSLRVSLLLKQGMYKVVKYEFLLKLISSGNLDLINHIDQEDSWYGPKVINFHFNDP